MKIFITGSTGFFGAHLVKELLKQGHQLKLLVHKKTPMLANDCEVVEGDATIAESFENAVYGFDAIINLIGIIREYPEKGVTFERLHVLATANIVEAAKKAGIKRYLQMSALGTRADAVSGYHKTKFMAEELVKRSALDWTIFRPSLIFGAKDAFVNMLAAQLKLAPVMPVIGSGKYRLQPIHADDVAKCFAMSLEMPETIRESFELCGNERMSYLELLDCIASAIGKKAPLKPKIPLVLMKAIIPTMQKFPSFPITMDQLQMLLEENICDSCWQATFKFRPTTFKSGIREYLAAAG